MKKRNWIIGATILVLLAGAWIYLRSKNEEAHLVLNTSKVTEGNIAITVTATGTVQPVDTIAIGSQVSGIIKKVYADFNQEVKKGQLLAQLDKSLLQAQLQQINASLQSAVANNTYQKSNYERQAKLYEAGAISKAELENALYSYKSASANIDGIKAQLVSANQNLNYADIYAPTDGTILSRAVSEGQTVAASLNTPTLFVLAKDLSKMQVNASIDEADIANVKAGQRVIFSVDAYPADTFSGTVKEVRLATTVTSNVVTYTTVIEASNADMKLKPGMTASVIIYTSEASNTLTVPLAALNFRPDSALAAHYRIMPNGNSSGKPADPSATSAMVWVKKDSLTIVGKPIVKGMEDETQVQVLSGLQEGDEVITGYELKQATRQENGTAKSPFLPSRPGGNSKRNQGPPPQ